MSCPSSMTWPPTRAPGTVSCIRFRQRTKVDLPQPDGPMIAVTDRSRRSTDTCRTAWSAPKYASSSATAIRVAGVSVAVSRSVASAETLSGCDTRGNADDEDDADEDEGARPGLRNPLVIGARCIVEDLQRKRGDRRAQRCRPELIA